MSNINLNVNNVIFKKKKYFNQLHPKIQSLEDCNEPRANKGKVEDENDVFGGFEERVKSEEVRTE